MLSPSYLDTLPDDLVTLWQSVEDDILRDVARRIAKMDTITETADWQLWRYEQSAAVRQDVTRTLAKYSKKSDKEIRRLLQQAGADSLAADDKIHKAAGADPQPVNDSPALLNLLNAGYEQTAGTWKNLTATTARTVSGEFEAACDRAWLQVTSGAFDYQTAVKRAVDGLAAGGIKAITYPSGHKDTLEVAVRRAVLTGVHQTTAKLQLARMDEVGCDFVEVTAHAGARPEHALWQGKQYHRGGAMTYNGVRYPDFVSATHYGSGDGLCGWNCRHDFWPFWPGLSTPNHSDEELEALNAKTIEYNGEMYSEYEISQMQRAAERKVRAAKRTYLAEDAAGVDTSAAAVKLKQARQQLSQFIQDTGAYPFDSSARTSVAGFGRSEASKAAWAARKAEAAFHSVRGSGGGSGTRGESVHEMIGKVDPQDTEFIEAFKNAFCKEYASSDVEHMLVITKDGEIYSLTDHNPRGVDCSYLGDKLKGSYNIHTHPPSTTQFSFSTDADIPAAFSDGTAVMEAVDYKYRYRFEVPKGITFEQWDSVRADVETEIETVMTQRNYGMEDYEECFRHVVIDETCKRLGLNCYTRRKR